jgi:hypothetical protein
MNHIKTFESFNIIEKDKNPNNITFWHGGNLDDISVKGNKKGRSVYGSGLYLAKHYEDVQKYAKGSRKLYKVVVEKGNDIKDVKIDISKVMEFINMNVTKAKQKIILPYINNNIEDDKIDADVFNNIIINFKAIKSDNQRDLIYFLIDNDIDYDYIGKIAYSYGDVMVLYNTSKIKEITRVTSKDKIVDFYF